MTETATMTDMPKPKPFEFKPEHFSKHAYGLESSVIRDILKFSSQPDVISFAGGLPAPELFPVEGLRAAADRVLTRYGQQALQYSLSRGIEPLREYIADRIFRQSGYRLTVENILITGGSQQGLDAVGRAFIERGDYIITSRPTYLGALQAFNYYGARYALVEMDDEGMKVEDIDSIISRYRPRFIYVVPNFQNPTGITMNDERRRLHAGEVGAVGQDRVDHLLRIAPLPELLHRLQGMLVGVLLPVQVVEEARQPPELLLLLVGVEVLPGVAADAPLHPVHVLPKVHVLDPLFEELHGVSTVGHRRSSLPVLRRSEGWAPGEGASSAPGR